MKRKFLEYSFSKSESSTGTKVPWGKSVWNICSRGTKVPQERKFHGAKVFGTFAPEERKFHRGESSMGQKCLEHLLPRNESSKERMFHGSDLQSDLGTRTQFQFRNSLTWLKIRVIATRFSTTIVQNTTNFGLYLHLFTTLKSTVALMYLLLHIHKLRNSITHKYKRKTKGIGVSLFTRILTKCLIENKWVNLDNNFIYLIG